MWEAWGGFTIGLVGSLHCAGMCGPIAFALPVDRSHWFNAFLGQYLYQFGRIVTYGLLGLLLGFIGRGFTFSGLSQGLSIAVGVVMIASVMIRRVGHLQFLQGRFTMAISKLKQRLGIYLQRKSYRAFFMTGLLNGLLPCGLVYMGLLGALGMASAWEGSVFMMAFGLGTFPMMMAVGYSGQFLTPKMRLRFQKAIPVFVVVLGLWFIVRGMGLGVNYLSPSEGALQIEQTEVCH